MCLQVRQLLLDPAVNHEFERILKALEVKTAEAKRLNEELNATNFQFESKQGRMLVAKCRTLTVSPSCVRSVWCCKLYICGRQWSDWLRLPSQTPCAAESASDCNV